MVNCRYDQHACFNIWSYICWLLELQQKLYYFDIFSVYGLGSWSSSQFSKKFLWYIESESKITKVFTKLVLYIVYLHPSFVTNMTFLIVVLVWWHGSTYGGTVRSRRRDTDSDQRSLQSQWTKQGNPPPSSHRPQCIFHLRNFSGAL